MVKLVFILTRSEPFDVIRTALRDFNQQYPGRLDVSLHDVWYLNENPDALQECISQVREADYVFFRIHGTITDFKGFPRILPLLQDGKFFFNTGLEDENAQMAPQMNLYPHQMRTILRYYNNADISSVRDMLCYLLEEILECGMFPHEPPKVPAWEGLYHRTEDGSSSEMSEPGRPVIGILFHWYNYWRHDTAHVDALISRLEDLGTSVICAYSNISPDDEVGFEGVVGTLKHYFMRDGTACIHCLLNLTSFSVSVLAWPGNGNAACTESVFQMLDVPVLQAMTTAYDYEEWDSSPSGVHPATLSYHVFQPEFDGQLITYPFAYTHKEIVNGEVRQSSLPIAERTDRLCRLAVNWARLGCIPMEEKRIAVILHNIPPRNDTIGCAAGLDTPASVYRMVEDWQSRGFYLEQPFADGQEIIRKIIDGVTNDGQWSSEQELLEKAIDTIDEKTYLDWYAAFSDRVHRQLEQDWGPAPGDYMTVDGAQLVPGILNGNLFIGLQPPRGLIEKAEELLHNTDIVCPHQYIGFYRWIEHIFRADAIVHVGTHGTLEWLPGKDVGLSEHCYPDLAIDTLPNLYPYIISNPGEGTQAKRRSYCAVVDHLIPSFTESGTYDELDSLDGMLKEYYHFSLADPVRTAEIAQRIWEAAKACDLDKDLELSEEEALADPDQAVDKIHTWVSRVQSQEIAVGLHIYGQPPEGERLRDLIKVMLRVKNGSTPSLRDGLCAAAGYDLADLLDRPAQRLEDGRTNAMVLEELDQAGQTLFEAWESSGYQKDMHSLIQDALPFSPAGDTKLLEEAMAFASEVIRPSILKTERELISLADGLCGHMVPTGPSGNPTRGNAHLLPTGANFYSLDPGAIPSRSSWPIGVALADQLLERYQKEQGKYPENIALLVYATEAMRTTGDDIAEILYLLGLRPLWLGGSDRVIGFEPIDLETLGRPRIDVTLRITGLFRDTFPNLIERIEDAVNFVAALEEPPEQNYIRKHIDRDMQELLHSGMDREQAFERASLRIFGDPPGSHGAGVKELVYAKKWETREDLGRVFTVWGCHAYGRNLHGEKRYDDFARRLAQTDVSVKNESNIESDMLGSDDFYNYFGGLVGAVATHSGEKKPSFIPSTANKEHLELFSLHEESSKVMRARINNPKWIESLKPHGYKGAQEVSSMVDIVFGWDATTDVIDDWMYSAIAKRYAFDEENAGWIRSVNLYAMQNIAERLLEAQARGMWNATEEELEQLREIYLEVEGDIEEQHG